MDLFGGLPPVSDAGNGGAANASAPAPAQRQGAAAGAAACAVVAPPSPAGPAPASSILAALPTPAQSAAQAPPPVQSAPSAAMLAALVPNLAAVQARVLAAAPPKVPGVARATTAATVESAREEVRTIVDRAIATETGAPVDDVYDPAFPNEYVEVIAERARLANEASKKLDAAFAFPDVSAAPPAATEPRPVQGQPGMSKAAAMMKAMGWSEGRGLGKHQDGITAPLVHRKLHGKSNGVIVPSSDGEDRRKKSRTS